jgi:formylglycine-generating enzyme required for sulfatase activity
MRSTVFLGRSVKVTGVVYFLLFGIPILPLLVLQTQEILWQGVTRFAKVSEAYAQPPERPISVKDGAEMVLIPDGPFVFGMNQKDMERIVRQLKEKVVFFYNTEFPQQSKTLRTFYIDRCEVTNEQYARFLKATGHRKPRYWDYPQFNALRQPIVGVGWADAEAYCRWANKRLPTEEEWEKAARGQDGRIWPWGNTADGTKYNGVEKGLYATVNVGSFPLGNSPYGVSDMAGNVWEMTSSKWLGESRTIKGGSFLNTNADVRVTVRWAAKDEENGANWLGFRCAMDVEQYLGEHKKK